jgi:hypothetical protein
MYSRDIWENTNTNAYPWVSRLPGSRCFSKHHVKACPRYEYFKPYLDYLLIIANRSFKDHLIKLEMVLARLSTTGIRVNISKSKFFAEQIEYLGYWIFNHQTRYSTYS